MQDILAQFTHREAGPLIQFIKYAIAGGIATAVHIFLFHVAAWKMFPALQPKDPFVALLKLRVPEVSDAVRSRNSMISNAMAFVFSNLTAYFINICWVFEPGRHNMLVEIALFYAVSGVSIVVGTSIMGYLIRKYGLQTTIAFGVNLVTALIFNYALRKFFIFKG